MQGIHAEGRRRSGKERKGGGGENGAGRAFRPRVDWALGAQAETVRGGADLRHYRAPRSTPPSALDHRWYVRHEDRRPHSDFYQELVRSPSAEVWTHRPASSAFQELMRTAQPPPAIKREHPTQQPHDGTAPAQPSAAATQLVTRVRGVTLTEADRADIMIRIRRGEKQADLAKEYGVSRAAITNLKQRRQMLEMMARSGVEEAQKRRRLSEGGGDGSGEGGEEEKKAADDTSAQVEEAVERSDDGGTAESSRRLERPQSQPELVQVQVLDPRIRSATPVVAPRLRQVRTSTTIRLLATLADPRSSDDDFVVACSRLTRLLLEEAIGWSYTITSGHNGGHNVDRDSYNPVGIAFGEHEALRLVHEYIQLEPVATTATLWPLVASTANDTMKTIDLTVRVPSTVRGRSPVLVFLDDGLDIAESLPTTCPEAGRPRLNEYLMAIHTLVFTGVPEDRIVVVVDACPQNVAQVIGLRFPDIHIVTTRFLAAEESSNILHSAQRRRRRFLNK